MGDYLGVAAGYLLAILIFVLLRHQLKSKCGGCGEPRHPGDCTPLNEDRP